MANKFDPYREALVIETNTVWPAEYAGLAPGEKQRIEEALHADPKSCAELQYIRQHTGFSREITATADDMQRLKAAAAAAGGSP